MKYQDGKSQAKSICLSALDVCRTESLGEEVRRSSHHSTGTSMTHSFEKKKGYHQAQDPHHCHTSGNMWSRKALTCLSRTPPPVSLYPFYPPPSFPISSLLPHHSSNRVCCSYSMHAVQGLTGGRGGFRGSECAATVRPWPCNGVVDGTND